MARLLEAAEQHYRQASAGIARLPIGCRFGIAAAALLYAEIGREVGRRDMDAVSGRAVVPMSRKVGALATGTRWNDAATPAAIWQLCAGGQISRGRGGANGTSTGRERLAGALVGHGASSTMDHRPVRTARKPGARTILTSNYSPRTFHPARSCPKEASDA